ncbi:MAG: putative Ig domain-containing protein, partial [Betaproteobacteria bacterium]
VSVRSNNTPTMNAVAAQSVQQGGNLVFSVVGTDPDGDPLTYVATGLPAGATFSAATGQFSWTSVGVSPGNFTFSVVANDGIVSSAAVTVGVTVTAASSGASPPPGGGGGGGVGGSLPASGLAVLLLAALLRRGRAHH